MPDFEGAFKKAGMRTESFKLRAEAENALRTHNNEVTKAALPFVKVLRAQPKLLTELAGQYLQQIAKEAMLPKHVPVQHVQDIKFEPLSFEETPHRPQAERSEAKKAAARKAGLISATAMMSKYRIDGRSIGNYRWHELPKLTETNADDAANFLTSGMTKTEWALVARKLLEAHQNVDDVTKRVSEIVSEKRLRAVIKLAASEAPKIVQMGVDEHKRRVLDHELPTLQ